MKQKIVSKLHEINKNKGVYLIIAPFFLLFFAFCVIPAGLILITAFTDYKGAGVVKFTGLHNFIALFKDEIFIIAFLNTLGLAAFTGTLGFAVSFLLAWLVNFMPKFFRYIFIFAIFAPTFTGGLFTACDIIFNEMLSLNLSSFWQAAFMRFPLSFGIGFLAMTAGIRLVPKEQYEAAAVEGVKSRFQELIKITLPAMKPYIFFAAVMQIITAFSANEPVMPIKTVFTYAHEYGVRQFDFGITSAACLLLFAIMAAVYTIIRLCFREVDSR